MKRTQTKSSQKKSSQAKSSDSKSDQNLEIEKILNEKEFIDSAKMAELGMVGGHIAHELSSPVGGMISFLKLIRADSSPEDAHHVDLLNMEKRGEECKEILQDLVRFSKTFQTSNQHMDEVFDMCDLVQKIVRILDSKYKNIKWVVDFPDPSLELKGPPHLFLQIIYGALQGFIQILSFQLPSPFTYDGLIRVEIKEFKEKNVVCMSSDVDASHLLGLKKILNPLFSMQKSKLSKGLTLAAARQMAEEQGGELDVDLHDEAKAAIRVSFKRLDLTSL